MSLLDADLGLVNIDLSSPLSFQVFHKRMNKPCNKPILCPRPLVTLYSVLCTEQNCQSEGNESATYGKQADNCQVLKITTRNGPSGAYSKQRVISYCPSCETAMVTKRVN